jgi:predicted transcriptional regulator
MTDLTKAEQTVFDAIMELCIYDYSAEVYEISEKTGMSKESVKGVVGSLTKKQMVTCESEHRGDRVFHDIFPVNSDGQVFSNNDWH